MANLLLNILLCLIILRSIQGKDLSKFNYPFLKKASSFLGQEKYDYIVIGGGTAGCPLAATLSQNFSVLLLERGGSPYGNLNISYMQNFHISLADSSPKSANQAFISTDGVINARARVLGGGTCINAGFYTRASPMYVKKAGWNGKLVNESYPWIEKQIAHWPRLSAWQQAFKDGLLEAGVSPFNGYTYDHLYGTKVGGTIFDDHGYRSTAADLLAAGNPNNLRVLIHARVQKIMFDTRKCSEVPCTEPLTNTPPGSPCGCVWPMQVGLRLSVALYTFFPLVSELAQEIAAGIFLNQSQVRIMGANAASQEPDKTVVLIALVPLIDKFNNFTAFLAYEKFWHKMVPIKASMFGAYEVLYVQYPGLPPSPPASPTNITIDGQLSTNNKPRTMQPLGVDIRKQKEGLDGGLIAVITLSSSVLLVLCVGAVWILSLKCGDHTRQLPPSPRTLLPLGKQSGAGPGPMIFGSGPSSASRSFSSSAAYGVSAKTFSLGEIEKATDNFNSTRVLGEGGFGLVYRGNLEDGMKVAVKVLKRDDHQGGREFMAEVEMLSRLHHRNLVKLIGICTEEHSRCLVYELIPNGSVESHLHGEDKETSPLDWHARMKIALGSARGLAYLHEDSSPRVIHRDFKSSNILLENDFTPKVSDFGLAKTALDGGSERISTRVMGTFGYVAPEYAMTGHLLVKSDVYSYGVVLLELLTGRKPIDMSQPPGQENLVTWARPFLTSKEGLETIIDQALGSDFPYDSVAKVAAIASMCVQPEVSHRPFMGEVVQALQLVYNECDEKKGCSGSCSQEDSAAQDIETRISIGSGQLPESYSFLTNDYDSGLEAERTLSTSDIFNTSARFTRQESRSFRRHSTSEPLRTNQNAKYWLRGRSSGSVSEHGVALKSLARMDRQKGWL